MKAALILNRGSRRGRQEADHVHQLLQERGIEVALDLDPQVLGSIAACGKRTEESGLGSVIVAGGDGTVSALARCFAKRDLTMGLLPLGTGNSLARDLGLPASLEACVDVIASGDTREIDLGYAGNDYFVNVVTVGVSTSIAKQLNPTAKKLLGKFAYLGAVIRAYRRAKPFVASLTLDGVVHEFPTLQVVVGNGRFHAGPFPLSDSASLTDGRLTVYALRSTDKRDLVELGKRIVTKTHTNMQNLLLAEVNAGSLRTAPAKAVTMDGEPGLRTPFEFRIEPRALRVYVPSDAVDTGLEAPPR